VKYSEIEFGIGRRSRAVDATAVSFSTFQKLFEMKEK
jgi:hypothetical protein